MPGLEVDAVDGAGMTALLWAAFYGRLKHIAKLKERGASEHITDQLLLENAHYTIIKFIVMVWVRPSITMLVGVLCQLLIKFHMTLTCSIVLINRAHTSSMCT